MNFICKQFIMFFFFIRIPCFKLFRFHKTGWTLVVTFCHYSEHKSNISISSAPVFTLSMNLMNITFLSNFQIICFLNGWWFTLLVCHIYHLLIYSLYSCRPCKILEEVLQLLSYFLFIICQYIIPTFHYGVAGGEFSWWYMSNFLKFNTEIFQSQICTSVS